MDPVIALVIALSLSALWLVAARHKLMAFREFSAVLANYRLVPAQATEACAAAVAGLELALGIGLLLPATRQSALLASVLLLCLYAAVIALNLLRGRRHIDCGCMGPVSRQSLSGWLVSRNLLLALTAMLATLPQSGRALVWLDAFSIAASVGVAALLYATINHLIASAPDLARLRS